MYFTIVHINLFVMICVWLLQLYNAESKYDEELISLSGHS